MIKNLQQQLSEEMNTISVIYWNNEIEKLQDIYIMNQKILTSNQIYGRYYICGITISNK